MSEPVLKIDGVMYRGWSDMRVQRAIEQAAGAFVLGVSETHDSSRRWPIEPGQVCELVLDDTPVIRGYVERIERNLNTNVHEVLVTGRDAAGDLVDCSALLPGDRSASLRDVNLTQIVAVLSAPFGLEVTAEVDVGPVFREWSIEDSETVWENIEMAARQRAVLVMSDTKGGLRITRAGLGEHPSALIEGENILSAQFVRDDTQRFNRYILRGQDKTFGGLDYYGASAAQVEARADDPAIRAPRVNYLLAEDLADGLSLKRRIAWELNIRRARGRRLAVSVQGWSAQGRLWLPNEMVGVRLPFFEIEGRFLIVAVTHYLSAEGSRTELLLGPREAYLLDEDPGPSMLDTRTAEMFQ